MHFPASSCSLEPVDLTFLGPSTWGYDDESGYDLFKAAGVRSFNIANSHFGRADEPTSRWRIALLGARSIGLESANEVLSVPRSMGNCAEREEMSRRTSEPEVHGSMADDPEVFISHSTHDWRDFELAHKLADGLRQNGGRVWIAPESIPAGSDWQEQITLAIGKCTHFVVILSADSSKSQAVLAEIELARQRLQLDVGFKILSLAVGDISHEFPGGVFLSTLQRVPYYQDFADQFRALASAVGLSPQIPSQFASLIRERTADFVGREYVFEAFAAFASREANGYFIIEGDPGMGKTAFLAEFVRRFACIAHFNIAQEGINRTSQFLEGVCNQLINAYSLVYTSLPPSAWIDGKFFGQVLTEAAGRLGHQEKLLIAVDALDEVDATSQTVGANILYLPVSLPEHVYFIVTRRRVKVPLVTHAPSYLFDLSQCSELSLQDIHTYLRRKADRPGLRAWMETLRISVEEFVEELARRSENNFMYVRCLLSDIERGIYRDVGLETLPRGLEAYYEDHWRRMGMTASPLPRARIKIVYILAELAEPASRRLISGFSGEDELTVQEILDQWSQFLHERDVGDSKLYSLYHASLRDFLRRKDIVQAANTSIPEIHSLIARSLMARVGNRWRN